MSSLWGFAYGDDEMVPISVGAARLAAVGIAFALCFGMDSGSTPEFVY
jgi:hypothetical protein